jgi:hypothetical protein
MYSIVYTPVLSSPLCRASFLSLWTPKKREGGLSRFVFVGSSSEKGCKRPHYGLR